MKTRAFYAVGHISNDTNPYPHLNGTTVNSALIAKLYGYKSTIITKAPPEHPYISLLKKNNIRTICLPIRHSSNLNNITTFHNIFHGNTRKQFVSSLQENITENDLGFFPKIEKDAVILLCPLINEVELSIFKHLKSHEFVTLAAQGLLRKIENGNVVREKRSLDALLPFCKTIILSDEDISFKNQSPDLNFLKSLTLSCPLVVLTKNKHGSIIYTKSCTEPLYIDAYALPKSYKYDFSGAGDVYAASFILSLREKPLKQSAEIASIHSWLKIYKSRNGDIGINTIPKSKDLHWFLKKKGTLNTFSAY